MEEHKNIDRLFQEKFKDFEVFPEPVVWKNIEKQLMKKKKRMIIPLWLRLGVAAAIVVGLIGGLGYFDQTDVPKSNLEISNKNSKPGKGEGTITKTDDIDNSKEAKDIDAIDDENKQVAPAAKLPRSNTAIAIVSKTKNSEAKYTDPNKSVSINVDPEAFKSQNNTVTQLDKIDFKVKLPSIDKLAEKNEDLNKETNTIQDAIALQIVEDPIKEEELDLSKWSIGSIVAPVYFKNIGDGSPIDASLAQNDKRSNAGLSYGIKINYKISDKLTIQSGFNTVELGYATKNAAALLSSSLTDNSGTNINSNLDGVGVEVFSTHVQNSETFSQRSLFDNDGEIDQTLNYIEWPVEAKFAVIQKKFGVNLVGGISTYVLYQNNVSLTSFGKTTSLGEASNINTFNFSGNLGLDLNYNVSKNIYLNASPMLKYQINTFSGDTGGFKPYFLGIYAGLNFRF